MRKFGTYIITVFTFAIIVVVLTFFYSGGYEYFLKVLYPIEHEEIIDKISTEYGVDPALICGIIKTESGFNKKAQSKAGALGLMQIMPETFEWLQTHTEDKHMNERYLSNPDTNIKYGTYFIAYLLKKYGTEREAICAYNAGMGNVNKWLEDKRFSHDGKHLDYIPFNESRDYVKKVLKNREVYNKLYYKKSKEI